MTNELGLECQVCGFVGLEDGNDGFFYCQRCGSQADGIRDTAVDNEEMILTKENLGSIVQRRVPVVKTEPFSQSQPPSQFWETLRTQEEDEAGNDGVGPTEPADFGREPSTTTLSYEDYYSEIRMRYVMGVQIMIELQIKALVEKFNVSPIIVDMVQPICIRFVASTQIFSDDWADEVVNESESQVQGILTYTYVLHDIFVIDISGKDGRTMHVGCGDNAEAVEAAVEETAVGRWATTALGAETVGPAVAMVWTLAAEAVCEGIGGCKGGVRSRGVWTVGVLNISDREFKCNVDVNSAASILINSKLQDDDSDDSDTKPYDNKLPNLDAKKVLLSLESKYNELIDTSDHCKDLQTYLEYCKDVVFAGVELSFEDHEEQQIIEDLWNFYQKEESSLLPS
ncbi:hypothetical protein OSB04_019467 [Centaurea solstitialis]|uniref:RRN7-type domain-containing protein n=1 Tax=Centaurea solstitialis TaxID=347529 RepID=A0AA38SS28_9ASTR|nr:hypothetical protein OSB04_019467 [Centaurea solstitialis]